MQRSAARRRTRLLGAVCATAAGVALTLSGCGRDTGPTGPGTPTAPVARLGYADDLRIADAEQRLVTRCMAEHGFRFWERRGPSLEESRPVGYVQDDVDWARAHGYGSRIMAKEDRARLRDPNPAYRDSLSASRRSAYDTALDGGRSAPVLSTREPGGGTVRKQSGGCTAEAERALYGDPLTWFRTDTTAGNLRPLYVGKLLHDPEFTRAVRGWSRCMGRAGHPFADPGAARRAARDHAAEQSTAAEARTFAAEVTVAVADARCARAVSLRAVGERREAHYLGRLPADLLRTLARYDRLRRDALTRAEKVVPARA
ncbi:hypothetical protein [Streptomyces sp. NPDC101249]|uniref:hypothetical protein n=1 Tax=Streptomyces sp. NPDC101249 TaxID=3366140 RepID=UPI003800556E